MKHYGWAWPELRKQLAHSLGVNARRISPIVTQMAPAERANRQSARHSRTSDLRSPTRWSN